MRLTLTALAGLAAAGVLTEPSSAAGQEEKPRHHQLQLGVGFSAPYNLEEPFINIAKTRAAGFEFEFGNKTRLGASEARADGILAPGTDMPTAKAGAAKYAAVAQFFSNTDDFRSFYADDYVLDWKGKAYGYMQRWDGRAPAERTDNSVAYSFKPQTFSRGFMRFSRIGEGFSDIRLYRKKYAPLLARGEIWNPAFVDYARRYDIVRTMDIQSINNSQVRRFDQVAGMDDAWGQRATMENPEPSTFGVPYEALFDLGVKADVKIWLHIPPQIGAPFSYVEPALRRKDKPGRLDAELFAAKTSTHAKETLKSPEWKLFARAFADRFVASGYPLDRPLYVEIGNEIWNNAAGFFISTAYARGIAKSFKPEWRVGHGYGVLSARFALALEEEFERRKLRPNVVYVIASHTTNPMRTRDALEGFAAYVESEGGDPKSLLKRTGVAATNYYGHFRDFSATLFKGPAPNGYAPLWLEAAASDPDAFSARLSKLLTDGPATLKGSGPWILAQWKEHRRIAEAAGSRFIGGYEGGSHFDLPDQLAKSPEFMAWWTEFHWGNDGAAVARTINQRLIDEFPGIIIANYQSIGNIAGDKPWIDGHYARPTPMMRMWDEFARPERVK
jgi:hypothetical protein